MLYQDRDWLYQKYCVEELSCKEIAELCGVHEETIRQWLIRLDIDRRTTSEAGKIAQNRPKVKKKNGENMTGKNNPMYGIHLFGEKNPFWGKTHTEETKKNMSGENNHLWKGGKNKKTCEQCGKEFEFYSSQDARRFCSKKCSSEFQKIPENNPNYQGGEIKRICKICDTMFEVKLSEVKKGAGKFCSRKCYAIWMSQNLCGKNNSNWNRIKKICPICRKEFHVIPSHIKIVKNLNTCSINCAMKYRIKKGLLKGEKNGRWLDGISFEPYGLEFNDKLKAFIRERDNYQCQECGVKENGKAHDCHHKNYNKRNNAPENFVTLCKSCHSKTNSNREYWQNHFMFSMQLRVNNFISQ